MSDHTTPYPFTVRPRHWETLDSYTRRLQAANFETVEHKRVLLTHARAVRPDDSNATLWASIVTTKSERDITRMLPESAPTVAHPDGSTCAHCAAGTGNRYLCSLCAHGNTIEQFDHFESNVCIHHQRWTGPGAEPQRQRHGGGALVAAEQTFRKLRKLGLMDAPLYLTLRRVVTGRYQAQGSPIADARDYPTLMAAAALLTSVSFGRRFFDPTQSFATAYSYLVTGLESVIGDRSAKVARELWLYFRATFLTIREALDQGRPYQEASPHDFLLQAAVVSSLRHPIGPLEPFIRYLDATDDRRLTMLNYNQVLDHYACPPETADELPVGHRPMICRHGHRSVAASLLGRRRQVTYRENCTVCERRTLLPNFNDAATTHPHLATELNPAKNGGVSARDIFAGSAATFTWTCTKAGKEHDFTATASNRTANRSSCPVCLNRKIQGGINDIGSLYPSIATEFDTDANPGIELIDLAPGSNRMVNWKCAAGHKFRLTVGQRTRGANCRICPTGAKAQKTLTFARPDLAVELHPTRNAPRTANDITIGSHVICVWVCPNKHSYEQTPERRNAGYGCPHCSGQRFAVGVNDPATLYPEICSEWHPSKNGTLEPGDRAARSAHIWWECLAHGHQQRQTLVHRIASHGCTECKPSERIISV